MTIHDLVSKWIREAIAEKELAKKHQNTFKLVQLTRIVRQLNEMRDQC